MFNAMELLKVAGITATAPETPIAIGNCFFKVSDSIAEELLKVVIPHLQKQDGSVVLATDSLFSVPVVSAPVAPAPAPAVAPKQTAKKTKKYAEVTEPKQIAKYTVWDDKARTVKCRPLVDANDKLDTVSKDAWQVFKNYITKAGFVWNKELSVWVAPATVDGKKKWTATAWTAFKKGAPTVATVEELKAVHEEWQKKDK